MVNAIKSLLNERTEPHQNKKWEEKSNSRLLDLFEKHVSGSKLTPEERLLAVEGPDEIELVYAGLEGTLCTAVQEAARTARAKVYSLLVIPDALQSVDYRTAVYINGIRKISAATEETDTFLVR